MFFFMFFMPSDVGATEKLTTLFSLDCRPLQPFFLNTVGSKPLQRKNWRMQMASWCENLHAYRPCKVGSAESAMRCNIECLAVCVAASWVLYGFVIYINLLWIQVYHERRLGRWRLGFGAVERGLNREGKCKVVVDSWGLWSIGAVWLKA